MRRREFITLLGGTAAAWPLAARAQQQAMPVVGFLDSGSPEASTRHVVGLRQGLADAGYTEGRNVAIEFRWANTQFEQLRAMADDLVRRQVAVIVAVAASPLAAKSATSTIPIVIATGVDPVKVGLVASLNRPGGNVTGLTYLANELAAKQIQFLQELVPSVTTVAYLTGGQQFTSVREDTRSLVAEAHALGRKLIVLECRNDRELDAALLTLAGRPAEVLLVSLFPLAWNHRHKIVALAAEHKIPAIYPGIAFVEAGGLMSYAAGGRFLRQVATDYVGKILKGAKPADLPIQLPTKFELAINLKTAKALGIEVPPVLLATADEVIE